MKKEKQRPDFEGGYVVDAIDPTPRRGAEYESFRAWMLGVGPTLLRGISWCFMTCALAPFCLALFVHLFGLAEAQTIDRQAAVLILTLSLFSGAIGSSGCLFVLRRQRARVSFWGALFLTYIVWAPGLLEKAFGLSCDPRHPSLLLVIMLAPGFLCIQLFLRAYK